METPDRSARESLPTNGPGSAPEPYLSGFCASLAPRLGKGVGLIRAASLLLSLAGLVLSLIGTVFDHAVGGPFSGATRATLGGLGLVLLLHYPLLAALRVLIESLFQAGDKPSKRPWDFASSSGVILFLMLLGQGIGQLTTDHIRAMREGRPLEVSPSLILTGLFLASTAVFCFLQRKAVTGFFRSMKTGVSLVVLTTVAVGTGVLIPQIDGFENPYQRVDLAAERADFEQFQRYGYQKLPAEFQDGNEQYEAFRWAEGYFLYHMLHLYGVGMPAAILSSEMEEGLQRFGRRYGHEEEKNRRTQMNAALAGSMKIDEIGQFINENEEAMWRFFEVSTVLHLNRLYKSSWFAMLLVLLGISVFSSAYKNWSWKAERLSYALMGGIVAALFIGMLKATTALTIPWAETMMIGGACVLLSLVLGPGVPKSAVSLQKLGFFVVHNGLLFLLIGGGVSKLWTERGILQLDLEAYPESDYFYANYEPDQQKRLPFTVRLDHFARQDWKALQVVFRDEDFKSRPPSYTLWPGRAIELDYVDDGKGGERPDLRLEVDALFNRVKMGLPVATEVDPGEAAGDPVVLLSLPNADRTANINPTPGQDTSSAGQFYLTALERPELTYSDGLFRDPQNRFRLAAAVGENAGRYFPNREGRLGLLEYRVTGQGSGAGTVVPVFLGETLNLPGGYSLEVADATQDFKLVKKSRDGSQHHLPLEEQPRGLAAIWVDLVAPEHHPGAKKERRFVWDGFDSVQQGVQDQYDLSDVILNFRWDDWTAPGPARYMLQYGEGQEPRLLAESGEAPHAAATGARLNLPGSTEVVLERTFENAVFEQNLEFIPAEPASDGWDQVFYERSPKGLALTVVRHPGTPEETRESIEMATIDRMRSNLWMPKDGEFQLRFLENTEMLPFEWRSVLSIIETDNAGRPFEVPLGSENEREIRVNDYFYYGGYRFFQTNADANIPTYSGIGVVFDPGIPFVLIGMYAIIAGAVIAFLVRPIVRG